MDVSHELRSPLTRLQIALALARKKTRDTDPEHDRIELEIGRLDQPYRPGHSMVTAGQSPCGGREEMDGTFRIDRGFDRRHPL